MTAIVLLSPLRGETPPQDEPMVIRAPANDDEALFRALLRGPESILEISFDGLTDAEQERALASFPGGRRCVIAA
jgi:hypothetical protein